jgi:hypothetical protein
VLFSDEIKQDDFDSDEIGSLEDGENNEVSRPYSNSFNGISIQKGSKGAISPMPHNYRPTIVRTFLVNGGIERL